MSRTSISASWIEAGAAIALVSLLASCGGGAPNVPPPRPLVLYSGTRLAPTQERLNEIDAWIRPQLENIEEDPSFLIVTQPRDSTIYPWEGLEIHGDTAEVALERGFGEAQVPYMIYAHLHLMSERNELETWLPEAADRTGFELERAIVGRTSDAWLYGRSAWDAPPFQALDEIVYSKENGYLDALIFTARPESFREARRAWLAENPGGIEEYRSWFVETFDREPPGLRGEVAAR